MSNKDQILATLSRLKEPICDDCLSQQSRVQPRNTVNKLCSDLEHQGSLLRRRTPCFSCDKHKLTNQKIDHVLTLDSTESVVENTKRAATARIESKSRIHPKINVDDLDKGNRAFEEFEGRDSMYRVTTFLLDLWWGQYAEMVDALTVLLLTWNSAFYRYGIFDQNQLEACLRQHWEIVDRFRKRDIVSFNAQDEEYLQVLFIALLESLRISDGSSKGRRSPVAVAKTLHLLAPSFLPIWDQKIAKTYGCPYQSNAVEAYIRFSRIIRKLAIQLAPLSITAEKSLIKRIDEFNYAKYTKNWI